MLEQKTVPALPDIQRIPVSDLLLDERNPRLYLESRAGEKKSQEFLTVVLWKNNAVDEVALSIAENGYYPDEPLLVIPENGKGQHDKQYIVIEGNRRLAAVKLLLDTNLQEKARAYELPEIDNARRQELQALPSSIHNGRQELWTHVGFRHINGTKPWDSFAKSEYIAQIHETYGIPLDEIALRIGDKHSTARRLYRGYRILRQAEIDAEFDIEDTYSGRFYFSHLYTAVGQKGYQTLLSIDPDDDTSEKLVPSDKVRTLQELMTWLFGKKSTNAVPLIRKQYPDLNKLREVISVSHSLSAIRQGYTLESAHQIALGDTRRFRDSVFQASESLRQALGTVAIGYSGEDDIREEVVQVRTLANKLLEEVEKPTSQ